MSLGAALALASSALVTMPIAAYEANRGTSTVAAFTDEAVEFGRYDFLTWPFRAGEAWVVCRGYGWATHAPYYDRHAFDLVRYDPNGTYGTGCPGDSPTVKTLGAPVLAAASGTVSSVPAPGRSHSVCVDIEGRSGSYLVQHIVPGPDVVQGARVWQGDTQLGTVIDPEKDQNANVPHIHFALFAERNCRPGISTVPFDPNDPAYTGMSIEGRAFPAPTAFSAGTSSTVPEGGYHFAKYGAAPHTHAPDYRRTRSRTSLLGRVLDPSGRPVPGASVRAMIGGTTRTATSDSSGRFAITGVPLGVVSVRATASGREGSVRLHVPPNLIIERDVILGRSEGLACLAPTVASGGAFGLDAAVLAADGCQPTTPPPPPTTACPSDPGWTVGALVGLRRGAELRVGPGGNYRVHTVVPQTAEEPWNGRLKGGPRCVDGADWWDFDRAAAGDPSGGTGFVRRSQAAYRTSEEPACRDLWAPETTANISGPTKGNAEWWRSPVDVTFSVHDANCGSSQVTTEYSVNLAPWQVAGGPVRIDSEGRHSLRFRSTDGSNREADREVTVAIDWTPPSTSGTATAPFDINGLARDAVTIELASTDNLSGVAAIERSCSSSPLSTSQGATARFVLDGNGATWCRYRATDIAGNLEQERDTGIIIIERHLISADSRLTIRNGVDVRLAGDVHSNCTVVIERNVDLYLTGAITARCTGNTVTSNTGGSLPPITGAGRVPLLTYPLAFYERRAVAVFDTTVIIDSVDSTLSGCVYSRGDIILRAVALSGDLCLVAERDIVDETTASTFVSGDPANGVLLFAGRNITVASTGNVNVGLLYAPVGTVRLGGTGQVLHGSAVGRNVLIDGATNFSFDYAAGFEPRTLALPLATQSFVQDPPSVPPLAGPPVFRVRPRSSPSRLSISWTPAELATGYHLQCATSTTCAAASLLVNVGRSSTHHTAAVPAGTTYYCRMRSVNAAGPGGWSTAQSVQSSAP